MPRKQEGQRVMSEGHSIDCLEDLGHLIEQAKREDWDWRDIADFFRGVSEVAGKRAEELEELAELAEVT